MNISFMIISGITANPSSRIPLYLRLSICPSVRPSVTFFFTPSDTHPFDVLACYMGVVISMGHTA